MVSIHHTVVLHIIILFEVSGSHICDAKHFDYSIYFYNLLVNVCSAAFKATYTRVVPKVMSNFFLHANWEQQTKESTVVDGTSCCVIRECLVTSIACIT